ncbi:MAG: hypothetical protein ACREVV_12625, partial [Steroidobacteraceae bacterium]
TPEQRAFVRDAIAEASLARGMGRPITEESVRQLAVEVKGRGRSQAMRRMANRAHPLPAR